ncbi:NAD(P)H-binding protein [Nonomuraea typhae]|uniref:NAD(P)H-binding protein n=1 Tax=Nonomuraea typhae TaxID=2603600 RepID=UPI001CA5D875|nr:NAD(P)H-binding protein [Nonomuraea typhae]
MILVTGATGVIGRPLVELLVQAKARVRAVTRAGAPTPDAPAAGAPAPVEVVTGDPSRPETLAPHLHGVTALFLHPRAAGDAAADLVALAAEHGVRRVVALAAANIDEPLDHQPSRLRGDRNKEAEEAAVTSGLEWVSLRPSSFAVNALTGWAAQIRAGDVVRGPYAGFRETPIDERDVAAVAAHALLADDVLRQRIHLTGPQALTHAEMVETIGRVIGRPLSYVEVPPEAAVQGWVARGIPEPFVTALMARYARDLGRPPRVSEEVARILGRPAYGFASWAEEHAAEFTRTM